VHFGGLGTAVAGLTRALADAGAQVVVLLVHGEGSGYGYAYGYGRSYGHHRARRGWATEHRHGIEYVHVSYAEGLSAAPALAAVRQAQVVHLHSSWLWPIAAAVREATATPVVYTAHSIDRAELEHGEWLMHGSIQDLVFAEADRVVVLSRSEHEYVLRHFPHLAGRVSVVGNGVHLTPRTPAKHHHPNGAVVLYVGRFGTRKGVRDLIEAVPDIARQVPASRFVFVGGSSPDDGPDAAAAWVPPRLRAHRQRMTFLGWVDAAAGGARDWYTSADVLAIPSRYEPFGMVVLEGMLCGQAIVAADTGGPGELLRHEQTALLYPAGDVPALAAALVRMLRDVRLRRRLGGAARKEVRERWTWPHVLPALLRTYADAAR
jgi:glycosyltransferase involved in cell wall biosynthesis